MTFYKKRDKFEFLSIKIGLLFSKFGIPPNVWTIGTLIPAVLAMYFLIYDRFLYAAAFFIIAGFIDMIDGAVAKVTGRVSKLGAYLDTTIDRYVEGMIIFGLIFASLPPFYVTTDAWIVIFLFGSLMTTYVKAAAKEKDLVYKELRGGILERAERLIVLFIGIVLAYFDKLYLTYIIVALAILSNISAIQRIVEACRSTKKFNVNLNR